MHNLWIFSSNIFQIIINKHRPKVLHIKSIQIKESRGKNINKDKKSQFTKHDLGLLGFTLNLTLGSNSITAFLEETSVHRYQDD